jgi:hypothetical protein
LNTPTKEYYVAVKINMIEPHVIVRTNLKTIILNKRRKMKKNSCSVICVKLRIGEVKLYFLGIYPWVVNL